MENADNSSVFAALKRRGYVYQCTDADRVQALLSGEKPVVFYLGIDPTADSLHIGHFFALMMFRHLQEAGHRGILVIGGATALIGDPSGKSDRRKLLTKEQAAYNLYEIRTLVQRFIKTDGENPAMILNNADWTDQYSYVDFMREIGTHFNVSRMLASEEIAKRLENGGLTFLEMGYMLMQAYDFAFLKKEYNCRLQIGGSDQWGNIVAGIALNRKLGFRENDEADFYQDIYGLTCPLLLTKEGRKMGKTETGTLWVAREKTTPFDFYQYFYNADDGDVELLLRLFTRIPLHEVQELVSLDILEAKRRMAYEITSLVHGKDEADKVLAALQSLYGANGDFENVPEWAVGKEEIEKGMPVLDILVLTGFAATKSEGRRLISQKGISVNGCKVSSFDTVIDMTFFNDGFLLLKKGKKAFLKVILQ